MKAAERTRIFVNVEERERESAIASARPKNVHAMHAQNVKTHAMQTLNPKWVIIPSHQASYKPTLGSTRPTIAFTLTPEEAKLVRDMRRVKNAYKK